VARGIGDHAPLRQFEQRQPPVRQVERAPDSLEVADSIIADREIHERARDRTAHHDLVAVRMVAGVVEHLGQSVVHDVADVRPQRHQGREVALPDKRLVDPRNR